MTYSKGRREGQAYHVSQLKVGDVVRPVRGWLTEVPGAPALTIPETGQEIASTRGWRSPLLYGPGDFRRGYDASTVVRVGPETIDLKRPWFHIHDGEETNGVDPIDEISRRGNLWYELLSSVD